MAVLLFWNVLFGDLGTALIFWVQLAQTSVFVYESFIGVIMDISLPPNLARHL
jgi:hypothetical protein